MGWAARWQVWGGEGKTFFKKGFLPLPNILLQRIQPLLGFGGSGCEGFLVAVVGHIGVLLDGPALGLLRRIEVAEHEQGLRIAFLGELVGDQECAVLRLDVVRSGEEPCPAPLCA